jgi:hypothetical protein
MGICETFQSQGTAETELSCLMRQAWGGMSLKVGPSHGHFENCQLLFQLQLESAQQLGLFLGEFSVGENPTGMELRHAFYRSEYLLVWGRSLACRGLLLGRRHMHRFR